MAEGTKTYQGLAVPLFGESEIIAKSDTPDIITITGYTTDQAGDFLVCQTSAGTEKFVVSAAGNVTVGGTLAASGSVSLTSPIAKMVLGTVALTQLASNASATAALSGLATNMVVQVYQTTATTGPTPVVWVADANKIGWGAPSVATAAQTVAYWAYATA